MVDPVADDGYRALAAAMAASPAAQAGQEADVVGSATGTATLPVEPASMTLAADGDDRPGRRSPNTAPMPIAKAAEKARRDAESNSLYHTLVPRMMVITALLAALGFPLLLGMLVYQGHLDIEGNNWFFDDRGRYLATAGAVAVALCYGLGWFWWGVAAALNARLRSRYVVTPFFVPFTLVLIGASAYFVPRLLHGRSGGTDADNNRLIVAISLVVLAYIAHFGSLSAYRRAAGAVGGTQRPWTFIIALPWVCIGLNLLARFFTTAAGDSFLTVIGVVNMGFIGMYVLGTYQALSSFDRACAGRHMAHSDRNELPDFLKRG
jgi:hypothetical protein